MSHPIVRWRIDRLLADAATWPWPEQSLNAHLRRCDACRAYYDEGVSLLRAVRCVPAAAGAGELDRLMRRAQQVVGPLPRRTWPRWAAAGLALAGLAVALAWPAAAPPPAPEVGVLVKAETATVDGVPMTAGAVVREGQEVHAAQGSAVVKLLGGRVALAQEGARLRFTQGGAAAALEAGGAYFRVEPGSGPFEVTAGTAAVAVKGTRFWVERRGPEQAVVLVDEGAVEVRTRAGATRVAAGEQTSVTGDVVAPPRALGLFERIKRELLRLARELDRALDEWSNTP